MKRFVKRVLILSFIAALVLVAVRLVFRRRSKLGAEPARWTPPAQTPEIRVEVHPPEPPEPAQAPAADVEPAAEVIEPLPAEAELVEEGVLAPPAPSPATVEQSPAFVEPAADPGDFVGETVAEMPYEAVAPTADAVEPLPAEPESAEAAIAEPAETWLESVVPPPEVSPEPAPEVAEPDFMTTYFDQIAATADEDLAGKLADMAEPGLELVPEPAAETAWEPEPLPESVAETPEPAAPALSAESAAQPESIPSEPETPPAESQPAISEPETPTPPDSETPALSDTPLLASLEQALTDLPAAPIVPPPRRTAESYLDEGNVYFNVSQYSLAIDRYTTAIEMDASLVAAYYNRANARTRAADFEGALADYNRALELQPFDADALNNRGMLHLYRANYAEALRDFNAALVVDPADTTVMVNRGLAHLHGGDAAAALVDFQDAATIDPVDAAAHYGAGQAAAVMGNKDEALRRIGRALELNPAYAREAAGDPNLATLQGEPAFLKLLRDSGPRQG